MRRLLPVCAVVLLVVVFAPSLQAREGFGMRKRAVNLDRRVPPEVLLVSDRIDVRRAEDSVDSPQARQLRDLIEEKMTSYDQRLVIDRGQPDLVLSIDVREAVVDESWRQKVEYESRQVGTKTETDSKGKTKEKPVYKNVPVEVNYKDVTGNVQVSFGLVEVASGEIIYSGDTGARWSQSYKRGEGAPMLSELEKSLIERVASEMSAKLVGATEPISVLIPRGSFDKLVGVAEQGNWDLYLRQVESTQPLKRPTDEAYRQYALGVAKEAMAYRAAEERETLDLLASAADHYGRATTLNPREKLFSQGYTSLWTGAETISPLERVRSAMIDYEKLAEYRSELASGRTPRRVASSSGAKPASDSAAAKALTNESIVELTAAGLPDENIILAIDGALAVEFDLSTEGLVTLAKSGVSPAVLAHMQKTRR